MAQLAPVRFTVQPREFADASRAAARGRERRQAARPTGLTFDGALGLAAFLAIVLVPVLLAQDWYDGRSRPAGRPGDATPFWAGAGLYAAAVAYLVWMVSARWPGFRRRDVVLELSGDGARVCVDGLDRTLPWAGVAAVVETELNFVLVSPAGLHAFVPKRALADRDDVRAALASRVASARHNNEPRAAGGGAGT